MLQSSTVAANLNSNESAADHAMSGEAASRAELPHNRTSRYSSHLAAYTGTTKAA
jgi:hypothetical protein